MGVACGLVSGSGKLPARAGRRKGDRFAFVILSGEPENMRSAIPGKRLRPRIWIIDAEHWPRSLLRAELIERGYDAVGFAAAGDAASALRSGSPSLPEMLVLELRGQHISKNLLAALTESGIPIVALGGTVELDDPAPSGVKWAAVFRRPFTIGALAEEIAAILGWRAGMP